MGGGSRIDPSHLMVQNPKMSSSLISHLGRVQTLLVQHFCAQLAQLVEHRTGIAEVTGSNTVEALIFSN